MITCCKTLYVLIDMQGLSETENTANSCLHQKALALLYSGENNNNNKINKR